MKNQNSVPFGIARTILALAMALGIPATARCADAPATPSDRLQAFRGEVGLTRSNIVLTLDELDRVRQARDPHAQFDRFVSQLSVMTNSARLTQETAQKMQDRGNAYFAEWESRNEQITNSASRNLAAKARAARKQSYDIIKLYMQQAHTNFTPLLGELTQIKGILEGDRSKEKVAEAKELFTQANWHCVSVQKALSTVEHQLDVLAGAMQTPAPGAPPPADRPKK